MQRPGRSVGVLLVLAPALAFVLLVLWWIATVQASEAQDALPNDLEPSKEALKGLAASVDRNARERSDDLARSPAKVEARGIAQETEGQEAGGKGKRIRSFVSALNNEQQVALLSECLEPRLHSLATQKGEYFKKLDLKIPVDHTEYNALRDIAVQMDSVAFALRIEQQMLIIDAVRDGRYRKAEQHRRGAGKPGIYGSILWSAPAGGVWGQSGMEIEIPFCFPFKDYPRLARANSELEGLRRRFEGLLKEH